jgi:glutathione S-transferase
MARLVSISYSPWSLRTRMALQAMGVPYSTYAYTPMLSEPWLRWRLRRLSGPVTVPVLLRDDGPPLTDSFDIVRWGSAQAAEPLLPAALEDDVRAWNDVADTLLSAGRLRTTRRVSARPDAVRESLPAPVAALGPLGLAIGRQAAGALLRKYGTPDDDAAACLSRMTAALDQLDQALGSRAGEAPTETAAPRWLVNDTLTYADITVAVGLSFVQPHARHRLGPASRLCWEEPALAERYAHLLAWRDGVMDAVRARSVAHRT